jgi:catechol 2,3-dioxygenase-like lactoylglutathione lyase family enzyme
MLDSAPAIGFLPSTDLDRSRQFFAETLGLPLVEMSPFACVLRAGAGMLRVTKVNDLRPQPFTVFGWQVDDIDRAVTQLTAAGVRFLRYDGVDQDRQGIWTTPGGDRVAWFADPDGNTLSLTQFTQSVASPAG